MPTPFTNAILGLEIVLVLAGLVLLWRVVLSPRARTSPTQSPLPPWNVDAVEFILFLALVMLGSFAAALVTNSILKLATIKGDAALVLAGASAQFGMLAAVVVFAFRAPGYRAQAAAATAKIFRSGAATFLISLPLLDATSKGWELLLRLFGVPAERQDLIRMFAEAKSPGLIVLLVGLAIVIAPFTEELIFRAGLFRFFRTRAPRFLALLVPGVIFASLHVNWSTLEGFASFGPLLVLALVFSLAYERTGHIGTTIVAHALFNLNTIVLIFAGLGT